MCFSSSGSDHFNIRKIKYQFFSTVFVSSVSKLPLFSRPPTLFLQGLRYLNHVSFYLWEVSSFFSFNVLIRWFPMKILTKLQVYYSSFFFFFGGFNSSFVDHIPFIVSNAFHAVAPLNHPPLAILYLECWRYIKRFLLPLLIRSTYFEDVISFKPFNSTGAISLQNHSNGVSLEWAITHRSFPRILPDSSNSPGVILKFFSKLDVRRSYHQSNAFSPRSFKFFHHWLNLSYFHFGVHRQFMVVFLVVILGFWRPKKSFS